MTRRRRPPGLWTWTAQGAEQAEPVHANAMTIRCPVYGCGARPGEPCTRPGRHAGRRIRVRRKTPHPTRIETAENINPHNPETTS